MFVLTPNVEGHMEWRVVNTEETDDAGEDLSDLLASSHYLDMFNDKRRNSAYRLAIEKAIKGGMNVLDIGTGTGLLAFLSARALMHQQDSILGRVTACEVFPPMATAARKLAGRLGLGDIVHVVNKRSDELTVGPEGDMAGKADLIVSEIVDSQLIGEGILPTMRHARTHLLKEDGVMIPAGAKLWVQLVESSFLAERRSKSLRDFGREQFVKELDLDALYPALLKPLTQPLEAFSFDFKNPPLGDSQQELQIKLECSGTVNAAVMWWDMQLDTSGESILSTRPAWTQNLKETDSKLPQQEWREHWKTCWAPIAPSHQEAGDTVGILVRHYDIDISIALTSQSQEHQTHGLGEASGSGITETGRLSPLLLWTDQLKNFRHGELWCMGVSMPDYHRTHHPLGHVEGFDMGSCNRMLGAEPGQKHGWQTVEGKEIWQCGRNLKPVTARKSLKIGEDGAIEKASLDLRVLGEGDICHALVFWIEPQQGTLLARGPEDDSVQCKDPLQPTMNQSGLLLLDESTSSRQQIRLKAKLNATLGHLRVFTSCL